MISYHIFIIYILEMGKLMSKAVFKGGSDAISR